MAAGKTDTTTSYRQKIMGKKVIIQILSGGITALAGLLIIGLSARWFGPEALGQVAYFIGIVSLVFAFTDLGLSRAHVHFAAAAANKIPAVTSFLAIKAPLLILALLVLGVFGFNQNQLSWVFAVVVLMELFSRLADSVLIGFEGQERVWPQNLIKIGVKLVRLAAVVIFGLLLANALGYSLTLLSEAAGLLLLSLGLSRSWFSQPIDRGLIKKYIAYSLPFALIVPLSYLQDNGLILLIKFFRGNAELGIYAASFGLFSFLKNFSGSLMTFFFPRMSRLYGQGDWAGIQRYLDMAVKFSLWFFTPLLLALFIFRQLIVGLVLGSQFLAAAEVFSWLLAGVWILAVFLPYDHVLFATEKHRPIVWINLVSCVLSLTIGWWLVPRLGAPGAAIASVSSWFIGGVWQFRVLARKTPIKFLSDFRFSRAEIKYLYGLVYSFSQAGFWPDRKKTG